MGASLLLAAAAVPAAAAADLPRVCWLLAQLRATGAVDELTRHLKPQVPLLYPQQLATAAAALGACRLQHKSLLNDIAAAAMPYLSDISAGDLLKLLQVLLLLLLFLSLLLLWLLLLFLSLLLLWLLLLLLLFLSLLLLWLLLLLLLLLLPPQAVGCTCMRCMFVRGMLERSCITTAL